MQVNEVAIKVKILGWGEAARHLPTQYIALNIGKWQSVWHAGKAGHNGYHSGGHGSFFLSSVMAFPFACFKLQVMTTDFNVVVMEGGSRDLAGRFKAGLCSRLKVKPFTLSHRAPSLASALISAWVLSEIS